MGRSDCMAVTLKTNSVGQKFDREIALFLKFQRMWTYSAGFVLQKGMQFIKSTNNLNNHYGSFEV
jgi:hypothetical protein